MIAGFLFLKLKCIKTMIISIKIVKVSNEIMVNNGIGFIELKSIICRKGNFI